MVKKPSSFYTVRFNDCDPLAHLNNSKYLDYFLNAREDQVKEHYSIDLKEWAGRGLGFVVSRHEIQYIRAVTYNEVICIVTALVGYGDSHLDVEMLMYDKEQKILKAILWTKFTHINSRTGKRDRLNEEVMEWVNKALINEVDLEKGMNARIGVLLNK